MANSTSPLRSLVVDYAWTAWSALGVAGWRQGSFAACIDIDALVLLTGRLGDTDARLRDESIDWCASNLAFVSRSRLEHLLAEDTGQGAWPAYAATLQEATKQRWPGAGTAHDWRPSHKSRTPKRAEGATLALRCRSLFGATVRGEIIRILLLSPSDRDFDARDLTRETGFTKRSIRDALDSLCVAGIVGQTSVGNSHRFHFQRRSELETLLGPLPSVRTSQRAVCRVLWALLQAYESLAAASGGVRVVEGARLAIELEADMRSMDTRGAARPVELSTLDNLLSYARETIEGALGERTDSRS